MRKRNRQLQFKPAERSKELRRLFLDTEKRLKGTKKEHVIIDRHGRAMLKLGAGIYSIPPIKAILGELKEKAAKSERKRAIYSFTPKPPEDVKSVHQLNLIRIGSYIPPHGHPRTTETWRTAKGKFKVLITDEKGKILQTKVLTSKSKPISSKPGTYHTLVPLYQGSVLHEEVAAKYDPTAKVTATWAPQEGSEEARRMLERMKKAKKNDYLAEVFRP